MPRTPWKPWHEVVTLRDDVKSGDLPLHLFAADLYEVKKGDARAVYQDPSEFFSLTYPTHNIRELAKDVVLRLAGKNDKTVRQLELTYGGGKTHTLITLLHLVNDPDSLPNLPAVEEFKAHFGGIKLPRARVAVLPFDKLDLEKGMEISDPKGKQRWLKEPWSVLAWQVAGSEGLKLLHPEDKDEERTSPPADPILKELLEIPAKDGLATLILIDEVMMYARDKVTLNKSYEGYLQSFFQGLTQAATKTKRAAIVASLLATDPKKLDVTGKRVMGDLATIFKRGQEEGVLPVVKEDVAEVLRRRFFTADSIRDKEKFRSHAVAALKGVGELDDQTRKEGQQAETRFVDSYPFHPDLTEVFYSKWTQMDRFQRTRGILRTFALALRDAVKWDQSPLVGCNVFLTAPGQEDISESLRELTSVAASEESEGKRQDWDKILQGELEKAESIQNESTALKHREIEQAVVATFIHSQPIGSKAATREFMALIGQTRPDKIEFEKGLKRWSDVSWFLDESNLDGGPSELPKAWRMGSKPNLRQMHSEATKNRVPENLVEQQLLKEIGGTKSLTAGASSAGARVHNLPKSPSDIEDDTEFHYAVLGPKAASMSGNPSAEARRYINETTAPDKPRVNKNSVVLAVPARDALDGARNQIREYLGWLEVQDILKDSELEPIRTAKLQAYSEEAKNKIPDAIRQAYSVVVTMGDDGSIQAFKITVESDNLFNTIKNDQRSRVQETAVTAEALLPDGPYNLWKEGETERRVKDLAGSFAQIPRLPKMLKQQEILNTLAQGAAQGAFVLRLRRPDRSVKTIWMQQPTDAEMKDPSLELVLPESAELTELPTDLVKPRVLPGVWQEDESVMFKGLSEYFSGGNVIQIKKDGYQELLPIPKASRELVSEAVRASVKSGELWLRSGQASLLHEEVPAGVLTDETILARPPAPIPVTELLPDATPEAWEDGRTTALGLSSALSQKAGLNLPWLTVHKAVEGALAASLLELTPESGPFPCLVSGAASVKLKQRTGPTPRTPPPTPPIPSGAVTAGSDLKANQVQDLADVVSDIAKAAAGHDLKFRVTVTLGGGEPIPIEVVERINNILKQISDEFELR